MIVASIVTATVVVLMMMAPFFIGAGGALQAASSINSPEKLEKIKVSILNRYLEDEKAFEEKQISRIVWQQRKQYLINRYVDAARRLDYLRHVQSEQSNSNAKA